MGGYLKTRPWTLQHFYLCLMPAATWLVLLLLLWLSLGVKTAAPNPRTFAVLGRITAARGEVATVMNSAMWHQTATQTTVSSATPVTHIQARFHLQQSWMRWLAEANPLPALQAKAGMWPRWFLRSLTILRSCILSISGQRCLHAPSSFVSLMFLATCYSSLSYFSRFHRERFSCPW
uniref:cDNA FLJ46488 fis, clone THYMU3026869 n=1 Tax=Homo sapiens TaxID=9606 RepID=Q6ZRC0_HUMAN|nr:unnamed protein product [Homo sapiens]